MSEFPSPSHASNDDNDDKALIDKFHDGLSLRDQLENTKNSLINNNNLSKDDTISQLVGSMQNHVMVIKIQDKLFYTTRRTLMGEGTFSQIPVDTRISNYASLDNDEHTTIKQELNKEKGLFTTCDSDSFIYVKAGDNLFQSMKDQLKLYDGTDDSINTQFVGRNPIGFEFVLEHLRMSGKVKCLGIEKFNLTMLKCIIEESNFFKTEKLSHYIQLLLRTHHNSEVLECENNAEMKSHLPITSIERDLKLIEEESRKKEQAIKELSSEIANKYKEFVLDNNKVDEFFESADLAVKLNVSGQKFIIPFRVLAQSENFIVTKYIQSPDFQVDIDGHIFIDRNPEIFSLIYSYLICNRKFNNFPAFMSDAKKFQLKKEAEFYGLQSLLDEYLDEMRYPIELLSNENIQMKERDDWLRKFYVKHRNSPLLDDMYLTLSPVFEKLDEIHSGEKFKIDFVKCPKILDLSNKLKYSRHIEKPKLVNSLETFKKNWYNFTQGLLEGLNWENVFAAGGGVLGCLFKGDENNTERTTIMTEYLPTGCSLEHFTNISVLERKDLQFDLDESDFKYWKTSTSTNKENITQPVRKYHNFSSISNGCGTLDYQNQRYSGLEWVRKQITDESIQRKLNRSGKTKKDSKVESPTENIDKSQAKYIPDPDIPTSFQKSDIDLFLFAVDKEEAEEKILHIYETIKRNLRKRLVLEHVQIIRDGPYEVSSEKGNVTRTEEIVDDDVIIMRTKHAVTFYGYKTRPIQVVLRIYKSPAEVLLSFDIDSASVGFDGNTVWSTDRCRRSLAHGVNLVDVDRQSTTYEYRLYKYSKRGFAVSVPGYHHSKVKNELLQYPRVNIFSKIQKNVRGLARLLMFDFACTSRNPKHILGCYDNPMEVTAHVEEEKWAKDLIFNEEDSKPSDYFNIGLIKTNRYRPKLIYDRIQKAKKVYNELLSYSYDKRNFFICTFNDIGSNFCYENEPPCIHVPANIEFITVEPGSQTPIGSFHPVNDNFFQIAYSKCDIYNLIFRDSASVVWMKSTFEDKSSTGTTLKSYHNKDDFISQYLLIDDYKNFQRRKPQGAVWFETYNPDTSTRIELAFKNFCTKTTSAEYFVSDNEVIDFVTWSVKYGPYHPTYPNQSSLLYREIVSYYEDESSTNSHTSADEKSKTPKRVSIHSYY